MSDAKYKPMNEDQLIVRTGISNAIIDMIDRDIQSEENLRSVYALRYMNDKSDANEDDYHNCDRRKNTLQAMRNKIINTISNFKLEAE